MNRGQSVFAQMLGFVPSGHIEHLVDQFASRGAEIFIHDCAKPLII